MLLLSVFETSIFRCFCLLLSVRLQNSYPRFPPWSVLISFTLWYIWVLSIKIRLCCRTNSCWMAQQWSALKGGLEGKERLCECTIFPKSELRLWLLLQLPPLSPLAQVPVHCAMEISPLVKLKLHLLANTRVDLASVHPGTLLKSQQTNTSVKFCKMPFTHTLCPNAISTVINNFKL